MVVTHKQVYRKGAYGKVSTTLCGRVSNASDDGYNTGDNVTCKLCNSIENNLNHWRNKNLVDG